MNCRALLLLFLALLAAHGAIVGADDGFTLTPGGVHYRELRPGNGPVAETGDVATIHLRGWPAQTGVRGKPYIDSDRVGRPARFIVGSERVMPGWNETVAGMRVGGKRLARIPSALGYGGRGLSGVVPSGSDLIFEIELLAVEKAASP